MAKHNISVNLTDEQEAFLKWLAKYDTDGRKENKITKNKELEWMVMVELQETMELYQRDGIYTEE